MCQTSAVSLSGARAEARGCCCTVYCTFHRTWPKPGLVSRAGTASDITHITLRKSLALHLSRFLHLWNRTWEWLCNGWLLFWPRLLHLLYSRWHCSLQVGLLSVALREAAFAVRDRGCTNIWAEQSVLLLLLQTAVVADAASLKMWLWPREGSWCRHGRHARLPLSNSICIHKCELTAKWFTPTFQLAR